MDELDDLERYFRTQFDQLEHICKSPSPWIFVCLSVLIEYLAKMAGTDYVNFITKKYPAEYKNFKYKNSKMDLPLQIHTVLRNGLIHSFSLTPTSDKKGLLGRQRSVYLIHRGPDTRNLTSYVDVSRNIDAATLVAEDFLQDTEAAAFGIIDDARRVNGLKQHIIQYVVDHPPISGIDQNYFWQRVLP